MPVLPTWDLFITLFFIIGIAYGLILQRDKTMVTLVSTYVALVVVNTVAPMLHSLLVGEQTIMGQIFIRSNASEFTVSAVLFILIIAIMTTKSGLSGKDTASGLMSPIELFAYSFLSTMLILSSIFSFMPEVTRSSFAEGSKFASIIMQYEMWWMILPVVLIIVTGFIHKSD